MSDRIEAARELAKRAHDGQLDKAGEPYINHPLAVAASVGDDESAMIVALLHDTIEDTALTFDDLKDLLTAEELTALKLLTHDAAVPYIDYVRAIKGNDLARRVKIADLKHNMDLTRLPKITDADRERVEKKYKPALEYLIDEKS
ncbi:MAG: bifunctional (p)ppGpp synthetase/guanosine-3',5'-bis(diphosphate) 3'-pyrophosphohydrolase [Selenomonadaceae bacterium]|nr:bifunctional (p)ppGpp synthetase/guanosine-3',5'-bis(diphosphate) 3'-pyrophosphohydrolase [Selenomonadaceae bacterium]